MKLETRQLTFSYLNQNSLIEKLDLSFPVHQITIINGHNGCGKSTLLNLLAGITAPQDGHVYLNKQELSTIVPAARIQHVAYLPQNALHFFTFRTGRQQFEFLLSNIQTPLDQIQKIINQTVNEFKLASIIDQPVNQLSGGELKIIALAIILSLDAEYLLLDEPLANLDWKHQQQVLSMLSHKKQHQTIIIAAHRLEQYQHIADRWLQFDKYHLEPFTPNFSEFKPVSRVTSEPALDASIRLTWDQLKIKTANKTLVAQSSFNLPQGSIGLLCGSNGCGKSTLFNTLTKQHPYEGIISFDQVNAIAFSTRKWVRQITYGFQTSEDQFIKTTVQEELDSARMATHHPEFWTEEKFNEWIKLFDLKRILNQSPYFISGGQQKKVQLLILALIASPVILLDEILNGLDHEATVQAWNLFCELKKLDCSVLIIDHQLRPNSTYDYVLQIDHQHLNVISKGANLIEYQTC